jgi:hypothetical protein
MGKTPIYTSETMVTRALAAEIRHSSVPFIQLLRERTGIKDLGELESIRCEGKANVDLELTFSNLAGYSLGIEAKIDHEMTPQQVSDELDAHDHLVLVLPSVEATPRWLADFDRVSVITWSEVLGCFTDCRITDEDIASMPLSKLTVEILLHQLKLHERFPRDWDVLVERGDSGLPAIRVESPELPSGRVLQGQLQVIGRKMPAIKDDVRLQYCIGLPVADDDTDFPDPMLRHTEPDWISSLRTLRQGVLAGQMDRLCVSRYPAGKPKAERGERKLPLADMYLEGDRWLVKGYIPSYLGIKSRPFTLDELTELGDLTVEIFTSWYGAEVGSANA